MAKFNLSFVAIDHDNATISVKADDDQIIITTAIEDESVDICLDRSTAIKFAKTLRTKINEIPVYNG